MALGFLSELMVRRICDKNNQEINRLNSEHLSKLEQKLKQVADISWGNTTEAKILKTFAYAEQISLLLRGTPLQARVHKHTLDSVFDPADIKLKRIFNKFITPKLKDFFGRDYSSESFLINAPHWLNFDRTPFWMRRLEKCMDI